MRNLTKSIAAVSLLIPASAYSLGIGDIKLHSALNQKLDAEIALLVSAGENISDIKVRLASPDKFDEAGVPWSYFLSKIKFKAVTQANGSTIVKLSSKEALREPFLDFLLEVTWASGNLYREFTVLVDPPVSYKKPTIPVIQKPQQVTSNFSNKPVRIINKVAKVASQVISKQYGPTNRTDSLWRIANKTNTYSDVSVEQMMMSIYEANPRAFYKKNVNALMAGKTLKIPSKDVILKLSKRQAVDAFKKQNDLWKGWVAKKKAPVETSATPLTSQLELEAPTVGEVGDAVKVKTDSKTPVKHIVDSEIDSSKIATSDEGLALQARMDKLEKQLVMMQKILILKNEEIAALQNKTAKTANKIEPAVKPIIPGQIKIKTLAEVEAEKNEAKTAPVEPAVKPIIKKAPSSVKKPIVKPAVKPKLKPKPAPVIEEETDYLIWGIGGGSAIILAILAVLWRRKKIDDNEEEDTESMFASASEISLPDSPDDELSIPIADDSSNYNVGTVGESSFLSEFTPSDFDAFDTDESEVDPVSEADVYLAYGRYQQAEDLMVQAIKDYPERDECKLKLLEIFYSNENKTSFEEYAKELVTEGKPEDTEFWGKVVEMGQELNPDSPLYVAKASFESVELEEAQQQDNKQVDVVETEQQETVDEVDEQAKDVDFDLSVFEDAGTDTSNVEEVKDVLEEQQESALADEQIEEDENVLDFDLSVFDLDGAAEDEQKPESNTIETEAVETIEFDLDSVASSEPEEIKVEGVSDASEIESFDFDLEEEATVEEPEPINLAAETDIDIDLENFDFSSDDSKNEKESLSLEAEPDTEKAAGIDDFDFDFDAPVSTSATTEPVTELDVNVADLTDMDELETKLDLAKAYIDMGDAEAATEIAKEVLEKGSEKQKQAAQDVLNQLK